MGFSVFGHFVGRFFGFYPEKLRFIRFVVSYGFPFFAFLESGFLAKIKQVRFLCGSLCSQMLGYFIIVSILQSIQVKLQCRILEF